MKRVTIRRGNDRRVLVIENRPFPALKKGDILTINGEGAEWTVSKVEETEVIVSIKIPRATAKCKGVA